MKRIFLACILLLLAAQVSAFQLTDAEGKKQFLTQYSGKWVVVNFWAPWCAPCLEEIPDFNALYESRKKSDLVILGVAVHYKDTRQVLDFASVHKIAYPLILGMDYGQSDREFGRMEAMPTTLLYDPTGKLVHKRRGLMHGEELIKLMETGSLD
jgi:thiol-disulfide isomerase/thioredoxin